MPKLERSQSDLRKPCYPQRAGIPVSEEHGSRSHPDNVWFRRDGRAPLRGGFSEPPKPQGTWEDRGRESIDHSRGCLLFAVKHAGREVPINSRMQSSLTEMNTLLVLIKFFDLYSHRFQMKCCRAWIVFFGGVDAFEYRRQFLSHNKFNRHYGDLFIITVSCPIL